MYFFKHSTDFQIQRKKETKELLVNKSWFYSKLLLKLLQIKYIKCVSIVIRNFTICWFKFDFLKKNFEGINFCSLDKSKHFAGTNFRDLVRKP